MMNEYDPIPRKADILEWIAEHDTLAEDFERHFGVSVDRAIEDDPRIDVLRYRILDDGKRSTLGKTMTLKQACDFWWDSVKVKGKDGNLHICFREVDGDYQFDGLAPDTLIELDYGAELCVGDVYDTYSIYADEQ